VVRYLQLQGHTREDRNTTIWRVKEGILRCGAFILGATVFSNKAITLSIEAPVNRVRELGDAIVGARVSLNDASVASLEDLVCAVDADDTTNVVVQLHVAFIHGDPDLKIDVPSVPG
jgi:hypothetical protein